MVRYKHAVFQDVLRRTYNGVLQRHVVLIVGTVEFANISVICIEVLHSFSSKADTFKRKIVRLLVRRSDLSDYIGRGPYRELLNPFLQSSQMIFQVSFEEFRRRRISSSRSRIFQSLR